MHVFWRSGGVMQISCLFLPDSFIDGCPTNVQYLSGLAHVAFMGLEYLQDRLSGCCRAASSQLLVIQADDILYQFAPQCPHMVIPKVPDTWCGISHTLDS